MTVFDSKSLVDHTKLDVSLQIISYMVFGARRY